MFVAYLDSTDRDLLGVFEDIARRYWEEFSFGTVVDPAVAEAQGVEAPAVVCYKSVDGDSVALKGFVGVEELDGWYVFVGYDPAREMLTYGRVKEASRPVIGELTVLNQQRLLEVRVTTVPF